MVSRLKFVAALLGVALGAMLHANSLKVKVEQGKLQGKFVNEGRVRAFLGIPYAAPPLEALRWRAPAPAAHWKGVRQARRYGAHCEQFPFPDMIFPDADMSEDCLFLNVFTPAHAKNSSKLPVMFWIHGGAYFAGSASEPRHDGDFLPAKGVVLVTINYRLGVFGFLDTDELIAEGDGSAGNYGLMDMIAALRWVKANIAQFGGDPQKVTIFGESAGSFAVSTLMASPMAKGLFIRAIGESGSALGGGLGGQAAAKAAPAETAWVREALGVKSLAELRAMPAEAILAATRKHGAPAFAPVVDGKVLTEPVAATYAEGKQAHIPLLDGWNRDEGSFSAPKEMTAEKWKAAAEKRFGDQAAAFLKAYPGADDAEAERASIDYAGDMFIAFGTWKWIEAQSKTGEAPVYRYHFELAAPPSKFHDATAYHSDEIEYVFGTLATRPGAEWRPEDRKLSEEMMSYWTNFAKTGDPNGPGLPAWPRFDKTGEVMHLDRDSQATPDTTRARYEFLLKTAKR